jgi:hypothetical protein
VPNGIANHSPGSRPLRANQVAAKELGDEVVLYLTDGSAVHVLNRSAFLIWSLCDGQHTVQEMEQALKDRYAIPDQVNVAADVRACLTQLADKQLLTP